MRRQKVADVLFVVGFGLKWSIISYVLILAIQSNAARWAR